MGIVGGLNTYAYVHDPNMRVDTMGLTPTPNLNTNGAVANFGIYEIKIDGVLHKIGKADLGRIRQSTNLPTRLHQQLFAFVGMSLNLPIRPLHNYRAAVVGMQRRLGCQAYQQLVERLHKK